VINGYAQVFQSRRLEYWGFDRAGQLSVGGGYWLIHAGCVGLPGGHRRPVGRERARSGRRSALPLRSLGSMRPAEIGSEMRPILSLFAYRSGVESRRRVLCSTARRKAGRHHATHAPRGCMAALDSHPGRGSRFTVVALRVTDL